MSNLLSPLEVKTLQMQNRIVFPPMAKYLAATEGTVTPELIKHYVQRTPHTGLVIIEHSYVVPMGRLDKKQLGIHKDEMVPGLKQLAAAIHNAGGKTGIQITHTGSTTPYAVNNTAPEAPSPIVHPRGGDLPRELSLAELKTIKEAFAAAALRAKAAGFDMVEIHGAHGYLLNQFYSPLTNQRSDAYGGSREKRLRYPLEVIDAVRQAVGSDYPVFCRFGGDDRLPGGLTLEDGRFAAPRLAEAGVDVLDLSAGHIGGRIKGPQGFYVYIAEAIKPTVQIPVMVTGGIIEAKFADQLVRDGKTDLVGIGTAIFNDPEWPAKAVKTLTEC